MKHNQNGFTLIEGLLIVGVLAVIGGCGYALYHGRQATTKTATTPISATTQTNSASTTQNIDSLVAQDVTSEAAIDIKQTTTETANAQSANSAAANMGGAYNESSL